MGAKQVPTVFEGQVWKDNDPRQPGRLLKVVYVEPLQHVLFKVIETGKVTKISWKRIEQSTAKKGYSLVAEPAPKVALVADNEIGKQQAAEPSLEDGKR